MPATRLTTLGPFDGAGVFRYLAGHAIPGIEDADERSYRRRVRVDGSTAELAIRLDPRGHPVGHPRGDEPYAILASLDDHPLPDKFIPRARRMIDLDADSSTIDAHLCRDPVLAPVVFRSPGIRLPGALDAHEELFRTLIGQQISIRAARTVVARLARELSGDNGVFPTAEQFASRGLEVLRGPASRVAAIHGAAHALASGTLVIDDSLSVDELTARLVAQPGIGPWTAGYVAMRVVGAPDILLTTDLVLLKGARVLGLPATPRELAAYGQRWAPFRSYANLHLWRVAQSAK